MNAGDEMEKYPWYKVVESRQRVTQGDILNQFPVPVIEATTSMPFFKPKFTFEDVIVMTQSCDLEQGKVDEITLCPLKPLSHVLKEIMELEYKDNKEFNYYKLASKGQRDRKQKHIDELRKGTYLDYYLLNKFNGENIGLGHNVVALRKSYILPIEVVTNFVSAQEGERVRLLPPYREHLAQAYARNFMRIGLPIDIKIDQSEVE